MGKITNNVKVFGNNKKTANVNTTEGYIARNIIENGFQPGTVISSTDVNTVLNQATFAASSLISAIDNATDYSGQFSIGTTKDADSENVVSGLTNALKGIKVNAAGTADSAGTATNVVISKTDAGDNANVSFSIGSGSYSKTVNNVAHASSADTAGSANQLSSPVSLSFTGDASGSGSLTGNGETVTVSLDVSKSAALDSVNVGSSTKPVYFGADGKPEACGDSLSVSISGNAATATTASNADIKALTGDVGNDTVSFQIGTGTAYTKRINDVEHAVKASDADVTALTEGVGSNAVSFKIGNGTPYTKTIDNVQNAATASNYSESGGIKSKFDSIDTTIGSIKNYSITFVDGVLTISEIAKS